MSAISLLPADHHGLTPWRRAVAAVLLTIAASSATAAREYSIDILSSEFYPQLKDAWVSVINDHGVAGGYIATETIRGPYLPTRYPGPGQFQTSGGESIVFPSVVTGIDRHGTLVGNLTDASYGAAPHLPRRRQRRPSTVPNAAFYGLAGINGNGIAYGYAEIDGRSEVFTMSTSTAAGSPLPLSVPGFHHFFAFDEHLLNDRGLISVVGVPEDFAFEQRFIYDITSGQLSPISVPSGYLSPSDSLYMSASDMLFGRLLTEDGASYRYGRWAADGSFIGFFDVPTGMRSVRVNDRGEAIGLVAGQVQFFDGADWSPATIHGLDGYSIFAISDFNNRGEFVGRSKFAEVPVGLRRYGAGGVGVASMLGGLVLLCAATQRRRRGS